MYFVIRLKTKRIKKQNKILFKYSNKILFKYSNPKRTKKMLIVYHLHVYKYICIACESGKYGCNCSHDCNGSYGLNCYFICDCLEDQYCHPALGCINVTTTSPVTTQSTSNTGLYIFIYIYIWCMRGSRRGVGGVRTPPGICKAYYRRYNWKWKN